MAKKPRPFCALPANAMADTSLTALDMRCLAVIAWHDGMSGASGKGGGCFARNDNMAAIINTDPTNFSKCLTKLIRLGYVTREPQIMDKRRFTLRVQYPTDNSWRDDQQSNPLNVGEMTNNGSDIVGEQANHPRNVVGDGAHGNGSFSKENAPDYISLNEELHFDESSERNSAKRRDVAVARRPDGIICQLPSNINDLPMGARVSKVEAAFDALDRDPFAMSDVERRKITDWLFKCSEDYADEPFGQQAQRLLVEMDHYD
jgi:hypothetical protein